jgi:hypothetical protein
VLIQVPLELVIAELPAPANTNDESKPALRAIAATTNRIEILGRMCSRSVR